jgi:hypothetical protein
MFGHGSLQHFVNRWVFFKEFLKERMPLPIGVSSLGALEVCFILPQQLVSSMQVLSPHKSVKKYLLFL